MQQLAAGGRIAARSAHSRHSSSCSSSLHQQQLRAPPMTRLPDRRCPGRLFGSSRRLVLARSTQPDTEEARSPLDAPQEWEAPQPSKRPDIFPEFEKMERVFLPKPLPGDPELPDEEEEEAKKRTEPGDPDPEAPPGEPSEPEGEPGADPEKSPDIPSIPE